MLHKRLSYLYKQDAPLVSEYIINYQAIWECARPFTAHHYTGSQCDYAGTAITKAGNHYLLASLLVSDKTPHIDSEVVFSAHVLHLKDVVCLTI